MKETNSERGARRRKIRAKAPGFFCIGEVQHGVDTVRGMTCSRRADPTCAMPEGACEPWRKDATRSGCELQPRPVSPTQRASCGLYAENYGNRAGAIKAASKSRHWAEVMRAVAR